MGNQITTKTTTTKKIKYDEQGRVISEEIIVVTVEDHSEH